MAYVHFDTGQLVARCFGAPSIAAGHDGASIASVALECLQSHPSKLSVQELKGRLVATFGDGGVCRGGPQAKHSSTGAAERFYAAVRPPADGCASPLTIWGSFHRSDTAEKHAAAEVPMIGRLLDLAWTLNRLFGVNAGAVLLRGVASELGPALVPKLNFSKSKTLERLFANPLPFMIPLGVLIARRVYPTLYTMILSLVTIFHVCTISISFCVH